MVSVKFEHHHDLNPTVVVGPFQWAQLTCDLLRVSVTDADNGEIELAYLNTDFVD